MKNLLIAVSVMAAGAATAQEAPMSVGNTYVELGTTFEDQTTLTVGTGVGSGALSAFGELSGSTDGNFQVRAYTDVEFGKFVITPGINYGWGEDGGDLVGFGDNNEWGDVTGDLEVALQPGIIGGEYVFANTGVGVDGWSLEWDGGEVGAGYKLDLAENVYLDGRVSWGYDDQFEGTDRRITAGFGLKF